MIRACVMLALIGCSAFAQSPKFIRIPPAPAQERPFWIAQTETTVEQFAAFVRATGYQTDAEKAGIPLTWKTPGFPINRKQPVVQVSPDDAMAYCAHIGARLPTDAEWEYAARAGTTTTHYWGDALDDRYLWWRGNSNDTAHPVAKKRPNAWGLYDIEGNVWEWSLSPAEKGEALANRRGGSWVDCQNVGLPPGSPYGKRSGIAKCYKVPIKNKYRHDDIGFRCARSEL